MHHKVVKDNMIILIRKTNPTVSGAVILLTDNSGTVVKLNETEPGSYLAESVHAKSFMDYTLSIISEGDTYMAKATIPQKVNIDSLNLQV